MHDKVGEIIGEAYRLICDRLEVEGIKYDSNAEDAIFWDDTEEKRTYCISLTMGECDEYGGD